MTTKVQKWGNSLAVRLPSDLAKKLSIKDGTSVHVFEKDGALKLVRIEKVRKYSLTELVKGITSKNRHPEVNWGAPRGKEVW